VTEPDVTLTDYGVALECAILSGLLFRRPAVRPELRGLFVLLFASTGIAALAGGTVHGFFPRGSSVLGAGLWRVVMLGIGLTALAGWSIGARVLFSAPTARLVEVLAAVECAAYATFVLAVDQSFWIAIANYAPSVLFVAFAFLVAYRRQRGGPLLAGLLGLLLAIAGAIVQQLRIGVHPAYFNHNALFHVVQMAAFVPLFVAARHLVAAPLAKR
jgi:hypothetical protein